MNIIRSQERNIFSVDELHQLITLFKKAPSTREGAEVQNAVPLISRTAFFSSLLKPLSQQQSSEDDFLYQCCYHLTYEHLLPGQVLFEARQQATHFYLLLQGELLAQNPRTKTILQRFQAGEGVAQMPLQFQIPHAFNAICSQEGDLQLACLPKVIYERALQARATVLLTHQILPVLQRCNVFECLEKAQFAFIMQLSHLLECQRAQNVYRENEKSQHLYVIINGEFVLSQHFGSQELYNTQENSFDRINAQYNNQIREYYRHYEKRKEFSLLTLSSGQVFGEEEVYAALQIATNSDEMNTVPLAEAPLISCSSEVTHLHTVKCSSQPSGTVLAIPLRVIEYFYTQNSVFQTQLRCIAEGKALLLQQQVAEIQQNATRFKSLIVEKRDIRFEKQKQNEQAFILKDADVKNRRHSNDLYKNGVFRELTHFRSRLIGKVLSVTTAILPLNGNASQVQQQPRVAGFSRKSMSHSTSPIRSSQNFVLANNLQQSKNMQSKQSITPKQNTGMNQNSASSHILMSQHNLGSAKKIPSMLNLASIQNIESIQNFESIQNLIQSQNSVSNLNLGTSQIFTKKIAQQSSLSTLQPDNEDQKVQQSIWKFKKKPRDSSPASDFRCYNFRTVQDDYDKALFGGRTVKEMVQKEIARVRGLNQQFAEQKEKKRQKSHLKEQALFFKKIENKFLTSGNTNSATNTLNTFDDLKNSLQKQSKSGELTRIVERRIKDIHASEVPLVRAFNSTQNSDKALSDKRKSLFNLIKHKVERKGIRTQHEVYQPETLIVTSDRLGFQTQHEAFYTDAQTSTNQQKLFQIQHEISLPDKRIATDEVKTPKNKLKDSVFFSMHARLPQHYKTYTNNSPPHVDDDKILRLQLSSSELELSKVQRLSYMQKSHLSESQSIVANNEMLEQRKPIQIHAKTMTNMQKRVVSVIRNSYQGQMQKSFKRGLSVGNESNFSTDSLIEQAPLPSRNIRQGVLKRM